MGKIEDYATIDAAASTDRLLATDSSDSNATKNITVSQILNFSFDQHISEAPATASSAGRAGQFAIDSDYIYACVATNTWKRVSIATW